MATKAVLQRLPNASASASASTNANATASGRAHAPRRRSYPLYPSVQHLLHTHHISAAAARQMPSSGPHGRLLKGDVLAHLGAIPASYPTDLSRRLSQRAALDLTFVKAGPTPPPSTATATAAASNEAEERAEDDDEVSLPISLAAVQAAQARVLQQLAVFMPVASFVARAAERANRDLPRSRSAPLSAAELFEQIVAGAGTTKTRTRTIRGRFKPRVSTAEEEEESATRRQGPRKEDIYDVLTAAPTTASSIFTVAVPSGSDPEPARTFLARIKTALEVEPGRLVLLHDDAEEDG
ncbi:MAG: pyridoxine biosynthesis protein [Phylliscum demangeonii]|nr:MAG: pyridoxine biosynthesis protein [Phylliscum demangeonii]